ncbi:MAG: hypothetical protein AAF499_04300 [Pseudomonadota bacterium]
MNQTTQPDSRSFAGLMALAGVTVLVLFLWQGNKGFNLWDEGFLWYGAQSVLVGDVPIRDFMAYDPGRYYWSALGLTLLGNNGIMSVRAAVAVFQAIGLFVALLLIARSLAPDDRTRKAFLALSLVTLVVWMYPRHKLFDIALSLFSTGALAYLVSKPVLHRYFISGICVGLVAVFGRNHGVYAAVASVAVMAWLSIHSTSDAPLIKRVFVWGLGVTAGFSPILLMALFVPGFAFAFWDSIVFLFEVRATNLPLPVPWPWTVNVAALPLGEAVRQLLIGCFFIGIPLFAVCMLAWLTYRRVAGRDTSPTLVAAAFLALPYAHFAYSRADVGHLALGIFPALIGVLVWLSARAAPIKYGLSVALCGASVWVMYVYHPGWRCLAVHPCEEVQIAGQSVLAHPINVREVAELRRLADEHAPDGRSVYVAPYWPGAYALLEREAPNWEIYALFPRGPAFEQAEIARIESANPGFAFILDFALDGRDALRFKNTHPLTEAFVRSHFERVPFEVEAYHIFRAKSGAE